MLYSLSPSTKRKYSNLKQLVGRQIVKRNKKTPQQVSPQGDEQLQRKGISKSGARQSARSDLEGQHACWESNGVVRARRLSKTGRERWSHRRVVSAFLRTWKQLCRHAQNAGREGGVGWGDEQLSEGCTERWEELGEFKIFNCNWLYFCSR